MQTLVSGLVAYVNGASNGIRRTGVRAGPTSPRDGIASLGAVAEQPVIALAVSQTLDAPITGFITLHRTRIGAVLAAVDRITNLVPVAIEPVLTRRIIGEVEALIGGLIAGVDGAGHVIRRAWIGARSADAGDGVAGLRPIAEQPVIALGVAQALHATITGFITLHRARVRGVLAAAGRIADFVAVAEQAILAGRIIRHMQTGIGVFIANIDRALNEVGRTRSDTRLALADRGVARLLAVAIKAIIALGIGKARNTAISRFITLQGSLTGIVAVDAALDWVANLDPVAELAVLTECVVGRVDAGVGDLITGIHRAIHAVGRTGVGAILA
jgi:hypothetical protein